MSKRPWFWGMSGGIELEFRDIREKDYGEITIMADEYEGFAWPRSVSGIGVIVRQAKQSVAATNLGILMGVGILPKGASDPIILVKDYVRRKGVAERLARVFNADGVKSAAHRRSNGQ